MISKDDLNKEDVFIAESTKVVTDTFLQENLTKLLHGSGFDGTWEIEMKANGKYLCCINYHCMNDGGYYDGWITLNYMVNPNLEDFKLTFTSSPYHRYHYIQSHNREFFNDHFTWPLQQLKSLVLNEILQTLFLEIL